MTERQRPAPDRLDENEVLRLVRRGAATDTFRRLPAEKKAFIYRTALRLFGEFGYDGLAVDRFCREAGISKGSFFQYFPSKSHLLEFCVLLFDRSLGEWLADIRRTDGGGLARQRLLHLYRAAAVTSRLHPTEERFYLFVTRALNHAAVALEGIDCERHFSDYVAEIIARGEQTGEIRRDFESALTG
ncbi:MAG TPA: helix-turn-helix domain-containing protein, partial [candidate division Zixibacteria bacterium]|nr:helix-turn-helix domain-containing protein [candidate division Zixibacteria bacterium]